MSMSFKIGLMSLVIAVVLLGIILSMVIAITMLPVAIVKALLLMTMPSIPFIIGGTTVSTNILMGSVALISQQGL